MAGGEVTTDPKAHWEEVYRTKPEDKLSWHQDEPAVSLNLIRKYAQPQAHIIDIGGGSSLLASRLVPLGYQHITALDISAAAIERAKHRSGEVRAKVRWLVADITTSLQLGSVDLWHDRAVFHFLTQPGTRAAYVNNLRQTLQPGGYAIIATFSPQGPEQCSGLPVVRYDAASLARELGDDFTLVESRDEQHITPWGKAQSFMYAVLQRKKPKI